MKIKLTYVVMRHTHMYNQHNTAIIQKINVTSALSRVESALHREDVTAVVGFQAGMSTCNKRRCDDDDGKKGKSVDEHEISVATTTGQLLS